MKSVYIGFDFSMDKPACTILYDRQFYFFIWPLKITDKQAEIYNECGVFVRNRKWETVSTGKSKKKGKSKDESNKKNSMIVLEHTVRSVTLANMILADVDEFLRQFVPDESVPLYIASEGLSFGSKGCSTLDLATYKGVLLGKLYEHYGSRIKGLYTYAPVSMKSVAGCAKKDEYGNKDNMINAFIREKVDCLFREFLIQGKLTSKVNYFPCVDDIVDSYWALKTMLKKEIIA